MSNKIVVKNIDVDKEIDVSQIEKVDNVDTINIYWKDYLKMQNYNTDIYKMCDICIAEQKVKYNGRTPIICTGLRNYKTTLTAKYGPEVFETLVKSLSEEELAELKAAFGVDDWFEKNVRDKRYYNPRWYQKLINSCSSKQRVLRLGRRSGKSHSVIMYLIYRIATAEKPINILIATPLATMIDEIEQVMINIIGTLSDPDFIVSKRSKPVLEIEFFNGSVLKGITLSNDGTSARGKKADIMWLDETDYIERKAMESVEAIRMDNPNVEMILSSTPKGEGNLYRYSQDEKTKEFHYPSYVIPHYSDELDSSLKAQLSEVGFSLEVLAIYGLDQDGVFQQHFIEKSYDYYIPLEYNETYVLENRSRFIIIIGVDWNHDNNGTRVVVTAYDKLLAKFFVVEKEKIAKLKLTQALAVDLVVELNRKYYANHIMCDEGFGIGQVTELRVRGREQLGRVAANHPDIKLIDTESVQFGSSLTITDPTTHETLKKNTKQYIVENAQKLLEQGHLALDDIKDNELILQMKNYNIVKTGVKGNIYKARDKKIGDHDLDAYMISLYCYDVHYGSYIRQHSVEYASFLPKEDAIVTTDINTNAAFISRNSISSNNRIKAFRPRRRW